MRRLQLLIVQEDAPARWRLRGLVADCAHPACEVVAEASSAAEALHHLARTRVDAVLLDTQPRPTSASSPAGLDGLALARQLSAQPAPPPPMIFLTTDPAHALDAFELDAVDCLLKPLHGQRLHQALGRLAKRLPARRSAEPRHLPSGPKLEPQAPSAAPVLLVEEQQRLLRIPVAELLWLKAGDKYVTLRTVQRAYVLEESLLSLADRLGDAVLRIHRNALVARAAVRSLERRAQPESCSTWAVQLAPTGEWVSVSRRQLPAVRQALCLPA